MFEASVDGQPYDADKWAAYYKPYGLEVKGGATPSPAVADIDEDTPILPAKAQGYVAPNSGAVAADEDEAPAPTAPVQAAPAKPSSQKAEDILAMIRNRKQQ